MIEANPSAHNWRCGAKKSKKNTNQHRYRMARNLIKYIIWNCRWDIVRPSISLWTMKLKFVGFSSFSIIQRSIIILHRQYLNFELRHSPYCRECCQSDVTNLRIFLRFFIFGQTKCHQRICELNGSKMVYEINFVIHALKIKSIEHCMQQSNWAHRSIDGMKISLFVLNGYFSGVSYN